MIRCVYTDLDGTLLGYGGSMFKDVVGNVILSGAQALTLCLESGIEIVPVTGRPRAVVHEVARVIGADSVIFEMGGGIDIDGRIVDLGATRPRAGVTIHQEITDSGAPELLLRAFKDTLEVHAPYHRGRTVTHIFRGRVHVENVTKVLHGHGHDDLTFVDNGRIAQDGTHVYHLLPDGVSKVNAVATHMGLRGYRPDEVIGIGDSREDMDLAEAVGAAYLLGNAVIGDALVPPNVRRTSGHAGVGFLEAILDATGYEL